MCLLSFSTVVPSSPVSVALCPSPSLVLLPPRPQPWTGTEINPSRVAALHSTGGATAAKEQVRKCLPRDELRSRLGRKEWNGPGSFLPPTGPAHPPSSQPQGCCPLHEPLGDLVSPASGASASWGSRRSPNCPQATRDSGLGGAESPLVHMGLSSTVASLCPQREATARVGPAQAGGEARGSADGGQVSVRVAVGEPPRAPAPTTVSDPGHQSCGMLTVLMVSRQ